MTCCNVIVNFVIKTKVLLLDSGDAKKDLGHILDFYTRVKLLKIEGGSTEIADSNIVLNTLPFDLTHFKNLSLLKVIFSSCEICSS